MSHLRFLTFRFPLALLCATILLPGCSGNGSSDPSGQTAPPTFWDTHEWRVTVRNQTDRYVWLTRYWTHNFVHGWHIEGANCIPPHDEITESIEYRYTTDAGAQLRAEIKPATAGRKDCSGNDNDADVWGARCEDHLFIAKNLQQQWYVVRAEAFVKRDGDKWVVPTSCDVKHW